MAGVGMVKTIIGANAGNAIGNVMNVYGGVSTYKDSRSKGSGVVGSVVKAVGDFAFYEMLGAYALPYALLPLAITLPAQMGQENAKRMGGKAATLGSGRLGSGYFDMSQAGYTMRQRALNQIRNNGQQIQSVLGSEARTFSRSLDY